ncbi:MAG: type II toxin-antitoxin system VapC family toxin [Spirochaetia bacterium]|jgi:tRNA(fMet)-specific endonuclease VapC|nr:type II toxin-antitoxin system VapC family toxin [Spirochaetia bacterium]
MKYLFDTNICIYLINKKFEYLIDRVEKYGIENIGISSITIAELEYGIAKSSSRYKEENRVALLEFLLPFKFIDFNQNDAYEYGRIRQDLQSKGTIIGNMDILIGSQAVSRELILVTNNEKEFKRIEGLEIENWVK